MRNTDATKEGARMTPDELAAIREDYRRYLGTARAVQESEDGPTLVRQAMIRLCDAAPRLLAALTEAETRADKWHAEYERVAAIAAERFERLAEAEARADDAYECGFEQVRRRCERAEAALADANATIAAAYTDAADEVHKEARWQKECQMRGMFANGETSIDRLLMIERILRDRAPSTSPTPETCGCDVSYHECNVERQLSDPRCQRPVPATSPTEDEPQREDDQDA